MVTTRGGSKANTAVAGSSKTSKSKDVAVVKASCSPIIKKKENSKKVWNTMSHLSLKRFADNDPTLTAGAKRDRLKHPHLAVAELDVSGRALCKLCGEKIDKASLRFGLYLECHKGYRNLCALHSECFWKHPETQKLQQAKEIHTSPTLTKEQCESIVKKFDQLIKKKDDKKETKK